MASNKTNAPASMKPNAVPVPWRPSPPLASRPGIPAWQLKSQKATTFASLPPQQAHHIFGSLDPTVKPWGEWAKRLDPRRKEVHRLAVSDQAVREGILELSLDIELGHRVWKAMGAVPARKGQNATPTSNKKQSEPFGNQVLFDSINENVKIQPWYPVERHGWEHGNLHWISSAKQAAEVVPGQCSQVADFKLRCMGDADREGGKARPELEARK
ncbi:hypothetical protein QBC34DRAFT_492118 [Podospora aff. communis PSN243]|uniref:Uncharacterized protein n=1 Tax=Podospora aff. communis PSN243 TaxID=3040156 RepID=A0AAV9GXT0_9PEZI|nr:hypothetical protein QBC34DRAFT_492118 [Podospora aff. communis PSN243]